MKDTITTPDINKDISEALKSTYGFNLKFALEGRVKQGNTEANIKEICDDVLKILHRNGAHITKEELQTTLTLKVLSEVAAEYSEYTNAVLDRIKNSKTFSEL